LNRISETVQKEVGNFSKGFIIGFIEQNEV